MFIVIKSIAYIIIFFLVDILLGSNYKLQTMFAIEYSYFAKASKYTNALVQWYLEHIIYHDFLGHFISLTQALGLILFRLVGTFLLMPYFYISTIISLTFTLHYVKQTFIAKHYNLTGIIALISLFILLLKLVTPLLLAQKLGQYQLLNNLYLTFVCIAISLSISLKSNNNSL